MRTLAIAVVLMAPAALAYEAQVPDMRVDRYLRSTDEVAALAAALDDREAEIDRLRARLATLEGAEDLAEAEAIGVAAAVKASGLPERAQARVAAAIVREARKNGLDPLLVVAVIRVESSFHNYAVSPVGAMGLMQVMPDTGKFWAGRRGGRLGRATNLFDPETNIELGASYLADLIRRFGSVEAALVAYNAGPGAAKKILGSKERRKVFVAGYPKKVVAEWRRLQAKSAGAIAKAEKSSASR